MTSSNCLNSLNKCNKKSIHVEGPKQIPKDETTEPVSLEMFNKAAND